MNNSISDRVTIFSPDYQAKVDTEIRLICRRLLTANEGINKSGPAIGINPETLWNQLTDGRVKRIPAVTVALVSAFTKNIHPLDRLCRVANHVALPIISLADKYEDTGNIASDILGDLARMIRDKKNRPEIGGNLMRRAYTLSNRGGE